ncbi:MAG: ATP-binding protein [Bryobacteraceae bacterium]|jgi:light-regulated signal transduction histidine kinase (bacteriophytochrome)
MGTPDQSSKEDDIEHLRKALEAEERRWVDLRKQVDRASAEFEEFVSMAAHNLRESLRDIASYSQLMAETCAGSPNSEGGVFLERIQEGAAQMQSLLADMVDYAAIWPAGRQSARVDMEAVLRQALLAADNLITERSAVITHDLLPMAIGDFETLTKVLQHLIRNAIQYRGANEPRVHISSARVDLECVFSVEDNGPGIDSEFQERIFGAFKRLHGKEHPGSGLGLAFCKKAIEWQGGRMWMESAPGLGSTFYFTLPSGN